MSRWYGALAAWVRACGRWGRVGVAGVLVVLVVGVISVLVADGDDSDTRWLDAAPVTTTTGGQPTDEPPGRDGGGPESGQGGEPQVRTGPVEPPPPYSQPFAQQPGTTPRAPLRSPTAGVEIPEGTDGCDHAYGDRDVCVPWTFPAGVTDKCAWLRERNFGPLKITGGRDRHRLDLNGDGIACGAGD